MTHRRGLNAIEVLVLLMICGCFVLIVLMVVPRRREVARLVGCQKNLMAIGVAVALYDRAEGHLPEVSLAPTAPVESPHLALLRSMGVLDLGGVTDVEHPPTPRDTLDLGVRRVRDFLCPSDPNAAGGTFLAPVSYRATAGSTTDGRDGAFAAGRRWTLAAIQAADGTSYTAGFAERLVGTGEDRPGPANYALVPGPIPDSGCGAAPTSGWKGDAGSSWRHADWRSTLYTHALVPNAAPSCLADDGRTAGIGASSGHLPGVNVLMLNLALQRLASSS